jgi:hypothetical protein
MFNSGRVLGEAYVAENGSSDTKEAEHDQAKGDKEAGFSDIGRFGGHDIFTPMDHTNERKPL